MSLLGNAPPRRRFAFMLTPLVDVMFLLLIFFMLSSQTSPYSLLPITAGSGGSGPAPAAPPANEQPELLVSIGRGYARLNGARVEMAELTQILEEQIAAGVTRAAVLTAEAATLQDVVFVLEAFKGTGFPQMRLIVQRPAQ